MFVLLFVLIKSVEGNADADIRFIGRGSVGGRDLKGDVPQPVHRFPVCVFLRDPGIAVVEQAVVHPGEPGAPVILPLPLPAHDR